MPYYCINVAMMQKKEELALGIKPGYAHLFATAKHSCTDRKEFLKAYDLIKERFPKPEFNIGVTYWPQCGDQLEEKDVEAIRDKLKEDEERRKQ